VPVAADLGAPAPPEASGGVDYLLVDDQVNATGPVPERYHHLVMRILSAKGVENGSEGRVEFDPEYEHLTLHGAWLIRGGRRFAALRPGEVKVIQRETELERRLYDGTLTAVAFLPDVRQGDVVEYAYTVRGANPVFGGRYSGRFPLAYGVPVGRIAVRLRWPQGRGLSHRTHGIELAPASSRRDGSVELRWERTAVPAVDDEDELPPGVDPYPGLELSEHASWAEVVRWALPLYRQAPLSPAMRARVDAWRRLPGPAERVRAALRFVQDEVRYLGLELGASSHKPHTPAEVFARRYGDCKDKSLLLVTLLRALGVEAVPALVNTELAEALDGRLPSPAAFDHVIVRAVVDGQARWLEPTRSLERAPVASIAPPPYRRALLLEPGAGSLVEIPAPGPAPLTVVSTWRVPRFGAPAQLEVVTTHEGGRAVSMRHRLAETPPAELQQRYLDYYARETPGIRTAAPLQIEDASDADRVVLHERYTIPALRAGERRDFSADSIAEALDAPRTALRRLPLRIPHPVLIREEVRIELPGPPDLPPQVREVKCDAARLFRGASIEGHRVVVTFEYRSLRPALDPPAVARHLAALQDMRDLAGFNVMLSVKPPQRDAAGGGLGGIAGGALVGLAAVIVLTGAAMSGTLLEWWRGLRLWRRRRAFAARFVAAPGDSPQLPIPVGRAEEIPARVARLRCACGGPLAPAEGAADYLVCGGRALHVATCVCERCGQPRRIHLAVG